MSCNWASLCLLPKNTSYNQVWYHVCTLHHKLNCHLVNMVSIYLKINIMCIILWIFQGQHFILFFTLIIILMLIIFAYNLVLRNRRLYQGFIFHTLQSNWFWTFLFSFWPKLIPIPKIHPCTLVWQTWNKIWLICMTRMVILANLQYISMNGG